MKYIVCLFFLFTLGLSSAEKVLYNNYKVYRLTAINEEQLRALKDFETTFDESTSGISFWSSVQGVGIPIDIMVSPNSVFQLERIVSEFEIDMKVIINDVQKLIDNEGFRPSTKADSFDWTSYYTLDEINNWLQSLVEEYPDQLSLFVAGTTYEGRDILGVKLSYSAENENNAVFIESNIHAREWITSAVSTYILNEFLTTTNDTVRNLAESYDWYFVPVYNPDGFAYTHETNRLWRKTRVPYTSLCYGADPNRNWAYHYNEGGSSSNACSETYRGPAAFSEPSTRSLSEFITTISQKLVGYISLHSYSQLLLIPYAYSTEHLDNYDDLYEAGVLAAESLSQRYGTNYTVGNMVEVLYIASGGSVDWVKGNFGVPITYLYELRDTGEYGFVLPAEQIIPSALETLDSLITLFDELGSLYRR